MLARKILIRLFVVLPLAIFFSCGTNSSQSEPSGAITAALSWNTSETSTAKMAAAVPTGVTTVRIIISAANMTTVQKDFSAVSGGGTVDGIAPGTGRNLIAQGLNGAGTIIYEGAVANITVQVGQTTNAGTITMTQVKPTANPISLQANPTIPYIQQQLIGNDPNGNTLTYELISPPAGSGYSDAYLDSKSGVLYLKADTSYGHLITLQYHVTNGRLFSDLAKVEINVQSSVPDVSAFGGQGVAAEIYATYATDYSSGNLYGTPSGAPVLPSQIDLSPNFPQAGNQYNQSSCVGWSTAYALKSYQERLETGWGLSQLNHIFSPAFIYHQINGGMDKGAQIPDALNLIVNKGAATLASMPYNAADYLSLPSSAAFSEAANFKAKSWGKVLGKDAIKAQLANKRPVVVGMTVYDSFTSLTGTNPVYNTAIGTVKGRHAVTIVGYDDAKYGGAFKVINSWGPTFGDKGYFWIPYTFTATVLNEAYILLDSTNSGPPVPDVRPAPTGNLPDLTVVSWSNTYDPKPGGAGQLMYEVKNIGSATASAGFDVCLMLSTTTSLKNTGNYVVCEQIPFALAPGMSAIRAAANPINFFFPATQKPGTYFMSLWIDDLNATTESNELNNWVFGTHTVQIANALADLSVDSWYLSFNSNGTGTLTYNISNIGAATVPTGKAEVRLVLSTDQTFTSSDIAIFSEYLGALAPGTYMYRNAANAASVNMNKDTSGRVVPAGKYYVALGVDPLGLIPESNKYNNVSNSWNTITNGVAKTIAKALSPASAASNGNAAYNGKTLPNSMHVSKAVAVRVEADGSLTIEEPLKPISGPYVLSEEGHVFSKGNESADKMISPTTGSIVMPTAPLVQKRDLNN